MTIRFTKMHGLGNDFVVIDALTQSIALTPECIRTLADRHRGVGCDQVLVLAPAKNKHADFAYRIFNADGNEVSMCGNGARCMGLFIRDKKISSQKIVTLETHRDLIRVQCLDNGEVQVDIGVPDFNPVSLPFITSHAAPYHMQLERHLVQFDVVNVGNPHCLIQKGDFSTADMIDIGKQLNAHPAFPEGINVGFMHCISRDVIELCVYERGVGITQACGSGACAAMAVGRQKACLNSHVTVHQKGGKVSVIWASHDSPIQLCGPAMTVFEGVFSAIFLS